MFNRLEKCITVIIFATLLSSFSEAQFLDEFDKNKIDGWFFFTGDGNAEMDFVQTDGFARIFIDATNDKYNVYWTLIKRDITEFLDLSKFKDAAYELRVEARVRVHEAPRRVNFMINTQRTTDFHKDLMEFDIPDTNEWHIISYTTHNFDALPGDTVYVQFCATDWGIGKYIVDLDYYKAEIVNIKIAESDKGVLTPYHPPIPEISTFINHYAVSDDCVINSDFTEVNFNDWKIKDKDGDKKVLTVNGNQWAILKWDFEKFMNLKIDGSGLLELTTQSVAKGGNYVKAFGDDLGIEFGKIRVFEIIGGDADWDQEEVTFNNLTQGKKLSEVFNEQMTFDTDVNEEPNGKTFITISKPVMQRLLDGKTKGLLIRPLGAINASFFSSENEKSQIPKLHFNAREK
ncbi:MAG: hypothetical protein GXX85_09780 [Ignavibacteria bacterium]|nr:hypothetical protein [Ignavibacteria bacterium]